MSKEEVKILICMPVSSSGYVVPGSIRDKCCKCGTPVWVAPSSWLLYHDNPGMMFNCIPCAAVSIDRESEKAKIIEPTLAQWDEIQEYDRQPPRSYDAS